MNTPEPDLPLDIYKPPSEISETEEFELYPAIPDDIPAPDHRWPAPIVQEWIDTWQHQGWSKYVVEPLHAPALRRLFTYRAEWLRTYDALQGSDIMVKGSRGNPRPNPLAKRLVDLETTILSMEKEFGMTLKSSAAIDMAVGEEKMDWAAKRKLKK